MPVTLQSATRENPVPCSHFLAVLDADAVRQVSVRITLDEIMGPISDDDLQSVLKVWARYQVAKGRTLGSLVGQVIFPDLP